MLARNCPYCAYWIEPKKRLMVASSSLD